MTQQDFALRIPLDNKDEAIHLDREAIGSIGRREALRGLVGLGALGAFIGAPLVQALANTERLRTLQDACPRPPEGTVLPNVPIGEIMEPHSQYSGKWVRTSGYAQYERVVAQQVSHLGRVAGEMAVLQYGVYAEPHGKGEVVGRCWFLKAAFALHAILPDSPDWRGRPQPFRGPVLVDGGR
jgi:hypothetical protein